MASWRETYPVIRAGPVFEPDGCIRRGMGPLQSHPGDIRTPAALAPVRRCAKRWCAQHLNFGKSTRTLIGAACDSLLRDA